ncbi:MAG: DUF1566 domain-containing protein [Bacteroidota bacterium]
MRMSVIPDKTRFTFFLTATVFLFPCALTLAQYDSSYYIVDTGQLQCYNNTGPMTAPSAGQAFYGQDAQHQGNQPQYHDNGDGTISDLVTGLTWVKARGTKVSWEKALADAANCSVGGYSDWRMPTIKELYSLIDFNGKSGLTAATSIAYLNTAYFDFEFGNTALGERIIDCQDWSATTYVHFTMNGDSTAFGVNFADGRIKGYGKKRLPAGTRNQLYVRYVRGNPQYGVNNFHNNQDSTISDRATGLTWAMPDSRGGMDWQTALAWVQAKNAAGYLGYGDWRLPNAKELQSLIDYTHSPATTNSAAIDPMFLASSIGGGEYPFYWTSTSHKEGAPTSPGGEMAAYLCFGRALGWMEQPPGSSNYVLQDVHGAGAQRSDFKTGNPANYPHGHGPQGDVVRIYNYVRLVRGGNLVIPVELSSLEAAIIPGTQQVRLDWSTQTEVNNLGFFIQRRSDPDADWLELSGSFTPGHGSTNETQRYSYLDHLTSAGRYDYRLRQIDTDGTTDYSRAVSVDNSGAAAPSLMTLESYPNPSGAAAAGRSSATTIEYTIPEDSEVLLRIFSSVGREVATVVDGLRSAGRHQALFYSGDLPSGSYLCRLETSAGMVTRIISLVR